MRYFVIIFIILSMSFSYANNIITGIPIVIDGDTIKIKDFKIRLDGIDTPESNQICTENNHKIRCGQIAANELSKKINRAPVNCYIISKDKYKRILAECFAGDESLNAWLVEQGYALAYRQYSNKFINSENLAKMDKIGIWQYDFQLPWNFRSVSKKRTNLYELNYVGLEKQKAEILEEANHLNATNIEKSLLLAVASIETEQMKIDYSEGDGKVGDAFNVSIFKMNASMLKEIDANINLDSVHHSSKIATNYFLRGLRLWGKEKFLRYHRGGKGAFYGKINENDITEYINAIHKLAKIYRKNQYQLNPETTDNIRYTIYIKPI